MMLTLAGMLLWGTLQASTYTLEWDANTEPNVIGYLVLWGDASGWYPNKVDVGNVLSFQFTPPDPYRSYCFVVRAYNNRVLPPGNFSTWGAVSGRSLEVCTVPVVGSPILPPRNAP